MEAILSNSTRKPLWFEITKMLNPVKNTFIVLLIIIFGTLLFSMQWWRQSSGKQSHTRQYCCLLSYAFNCASVNWRFLQSVQENNHIRGSTVFCSVMHSTAQVLTEDFCNQFKKTITYMAVLLSAQLCIQLCNC